jgi:hypothetical protein
MPSARQIERGPDRQPEHDPEHRPRPEPDDPAQAGRAPGDRKRERDPRQGAQDRHRPWQTDAANDRTR